MLNLIATNYLEKEAAGLKHLLLSNVDDVAKAGYKGIKNIAGKILPGLKQAGDDFVQAGKTVAARRAKQIAEAASPTINAVDDAVTRGKNALHTLKGNITGKTAEDFANLAISESASRDYYKGELARVISGQGKANSKIAKLINVIKQTKADAAKELATVRGVNEGLTQKLNDANMNISNIRSAFDKYKKQAINRIMSLQNGDAVKLKKDVAAVAAKAGKDRTTIQGLQNVVASENKLRRAAEASRDSFKNLYDQATKAANTANAERDGFRALYEEGKRTAAKAAKAATVQDQKGRLKLKGALQALKNERLKKNLAYAGIPTAGITGFGISHFSNKNEG